MHQNQFFGGEQICLKVDCDNNKSSYAVKHFKFMFFRLFQHKDSKTGAQSQEETKLFVYKEMKVKPKERLVRELVLDVPLEFRDEALTGSWLGDVFAIEYVLRVKVKFEQWKGNYEAEFPIKFMSSPQLVKSDEAYRVPEVWNPIICTQEPCYLFQQGKYSPF